MCLGQIRSVEFAGLPWPMNGPHSTSLESQVVMAHFVAPPSCQTIPSLRHLILFFHWNYSFKPELITLINQLLLAPFTALSISATLTNIEHHQCTAVHGAPIVFMIYYEVTMSDPSPVFLYISEKPQIIIHG